MQFHMESLSPLGDRHFINDESGNTVGELITREKTLAHLVAAAPQMLTALERICAEAESWHSVHGHGPGSVQCDSICQLIPEMHRAIHKAKGQ